MLFISFFKHYVSGHRKYLRSKKKHQTQWQQYSSTSLRAPFKTISHCYQQQSSLGLKSHSDDHTRQTYYFISTRARVRIINILLTSVCSALPPQLPVPVALFPLDGTYGTKEINGRQPDGIPYGVKLAPGPDGEQNGSYEFFFKKRIATCILNFIII